MRRLLPFGPALAAALLLLSATFAHAGTYTWNNAAGGNWNVTTNWTPNGTPAGTDTVVINTAGTYTVTLNVNVTLAQLRIGGGASGTQTLTGSARTLTVNGPVTIASNGVLDLSSSTTNGTGAVTNNGTLKLTGGTMSQPVTNNGLYIASLSVSQTGALTTTAASTLRVLGTASGNALLTVANGFTNNGTLELTNSSLNIYAQLAVTAGTLTNAPGANINLLPGSGGVSRDLLCAVANQGTITVSSNGTINKSGVAHSNSGLIDVTGANLTITQTGVGQFTNTNTIHVGAGRTLTLSGATTTRFYQNSGSLAGAGDIVLNAETLVLNQGVFTSNSHLSATSSAQINGPDTLHVSSGQTNTFNNLTLAAPTEIESGATLDINSSAVNAYMHNLGTLVLRASNTASATFSYASEPSGTLRVLGSASGNALFTTANGFTNNGTIELTNNSINTYAQLAITSGTLTNSPGANINLLPGSGGVSRDLLCAVANQGTITVSSNGTINKSGVAHSNSGLIDITGGNLTITQTGVGQFTNTNTINVGASRTLTLSGATTTRFYQNSGSLAGAGSIVLNAETLVLNQGLFTSNSHLSAASSAQINGPDTLHVSSGQTNTFNNLTLAAPTVIESGGTLDINSSAVNAYLHDLGTFVLRTANTASASFTYASEPGGTLRVLGSTSGNGLFTAATGFTNYGTIELTNNSINTYAQLAITSGTLTNAPGANINLLPGSGGVSRDLLCAVANQGTITVSSNGTINKSGVAHSNSGLIDITGGNLTITQTGVGQFTNTNTINVGASRTLTLSGATTTRFYQNSGSLAGAGDIVLNAETLVLNQGLFTSNSHLSAASSAQINGPDTLHVSSGQTNTFNNLTLAAPTVIESGATLDINSSAVNGYLHLLGLLITRSGTTASAAFTFASEPSGTLRVLGSASGNALFTAANGFTNNGTIELTNNSINTYAQLAITSGTLTNSPGANINLLAGSGGVTRDLLCAVANQGTITVSNNGSITKGSVAHTNTGLIQVVGGNLTITQTGTGTFTNTNTIAVGAGRTLTLAGAAGTKFFQNAGSLAGAGDIVLNAENLVLNQDVTTGSTRLSSATSCTISGPDTLHIASGQTNSFLNLTLTAPTVVESGATLDINSSAVNGYLHLLGLLITRAGTTASAAFTFASEPSGTLRVLGSASGNALFTAANGFTNNGTIELTNNSINTYAELAVTTGTLVNAPGANIALLPGAGGVTRDLLCAIANQGTITVSQATAITKANAVHTNSGLIQIVGGNLTITQTGTGTFTNTNTINVGASRTLTLTGAAGTKFFQNAGSIGGAGSIVLNAENLVLNQGVTTANTHLSSTTSCSIAGPDTLRIASGQTNGFANLTLTAPTVVESGATLDLISSDLNGYLHLSGLLLLRASSTANGAFVFASEPSGTMRILGSTSGNALFTSANTFTNNGTIELTNNSINTYAELAVTTGSLINGPTGLIHTLNGSGGVTRDFLCAIDNRGTILIDSPTLITKAGAAHVNSGTFSVAGGNLTVSQSGATPSFVNRGTFDVAATRTATFTLGALRNAASGILSGSGTLSVTSTFTDSGTTRAGSPTGRLTLVGSKSTASTALVIGQIGSGVDPILAQGQWSQNTPATLNGTLQVQLLPGVLPAAGHEFWLMKYPSKTGSFSAILLPTDSLGRSFLAFVRDTGVVVVPFDQTWARLFPDGDGPLAREGHTAVLDTLGDRLIVFGGLGDSGALGDVFVLSHATSSATGYPAWSKLTPGGATPPARRYDHAAAYNRVSNRMVILGGTDSSGTARSDYHILTNANGTGGAPQWLSYTIPAGVGPLTGASAAFDEANDRLIVFGGEDGTGCAGLKNTVWVVTNADGGFGPPAWTALTPAGTSAPTVRRGASVSYDPVRNTLAVYGGETCGGPASDVAWVLSDANGIGAPAWTALSPAGSAAPLLTQTRAALDPSNGWLDIFGGSVGGAVTDTCWTLTDASGGPAPSWYPRSQYGTTPPARAHHSLAMGSRNHVSILFGGRGLNGKLSDVWRRETDFGRVLSVDGGGDPVVPPAGRIVRTGFSRPPAPNPARGATSFAIAVARAQDLNLSVFDIAGRQVAELHRGPLAAGEHVVRWDGRGGDGATVRAGLYLVRLRGTGVDETKRVVLAP